MKKSVPALMPISGKRISVSNERGKNMSVSVIIPYIESSDLILKTADSVKNQKNTDIGGIELLVADITAENMEAM